MTEVELTEQPKYKRLLDSMTGVICSCRDPEPADDDSRPMVCTRCLLPMENGEYRPCAACLRPLPFGKARLMWGPRGTYRLCKGWKGCRTRAERRLRRLEAEGDAETADALRRFLRQ